MFVGRMSVSVGKALRSIWLYRAHFDRPDSQPCSFRWVLAWGFGEVSTAQRKLLLLGSSVSPADPSFGGHTGDGLLEASGEHTKVIELLAGSPTFSRCLGLPQLSSVLSWRKSNGTKSKPQKLPHSRDREWHSSIPWRQRVETLLMRGKKYTEPDFEL